MPTPSAAEPRDLVQKIFDLERRARELHTATRNSSPAPLYVHYLPHVVASTSAQVSVIGVGKGLGSPLLPSSFWYPGRRISWLPEGTYQTPVTPGNVIVRAKVGSVVVGQLNVGAGLLATSSATASLQGRVDVVCVAVANGVARLVADGAMTFGVVATGMPASLLFSTAESVRLGYTTASAGTSGASATVDVPVASAALFDVTSQWSNAQAGQGTTITQAVLKEAA